ncbi:MAG TPA: OadG family transporter subunit [Vicinamibacteria bacterium]|nr:OadG family transporter subunit [Vicinamibacteria bacterium]
METMGPGLRVTVYGMTLVFLLLAFLGALVRLLLATDGADATAASASAQAPSAAARVPLASPLSDPEMLAAAVIAVRAHRIHLRRQAAPALRAHLPGTLPSRWVGAGRTRQNRSFTPGGRYT